MIDLALVLGIFAVIGRTFGGRTAWIAMLVFGATDFPVTGSNWVGATLRYDWLALLGLSSCAWKASEEMAPSRATCRKRSSLS